MLMDSLNRDPTAPVRLLRSEPARSTRWNFALEYAPLCRRIASRVKCLCSRMMVKMACERDDSAFIFVPPVVRPTLPFSNRRTISSNERVSSSRMPLTTMAPSARSRIEMAFVVVSGCNKSRTSSLCTSRNAHRTEISDVPLRRSMPAKTSEMTRGMTPTSSSSRLEEFPLPMVYVLPLPVWPYARTVAL